MEFVSDSLSINKEGHLTIGGADVVSLAREYGTPLYLMDEDAIRRNCRFYTSALSASYPGKSAAAYAGKAFLCKHMISLLAEEGLHADVASGGELYTALAGGMPPERIVFHGNNKTESELRYALESGVGRIIVNGTDELERLSRVACELKKTASVTLRLSPGILADTHSALQTGRLDTKFGIPIETGAAMDAVNLALALNGISLEGIHCHLGSPIFETEPYAQAANTMMAFMAQVRDELSFTFKELVLGGGFAVRYLPEQTVRPLQEYITVISNAVQDVAARYSLPLPSLMIEPGRSIVASAGITIYTVGSIKEIPGIRTYVSVDGGMTDNPRYMLYGAKYDITLPERAAEVKTQTVTLAGRCCENELIGEHMQVQPVREGDLLAVLVTGAYNYSMASNYNRVPKPPVVMVRNGVPFVAVRRETWEDVARMDN